DVHQAGIAMKYAIAYDIIKGTGILDTLHDIDEYIRGEIAQRCYEFLNNPLTYYMPNNHQTRAYSALGILAMTIADYDGEIGSPDEWYSFALEMVSSVFRYVQVDEDFGYAEGPTYLRYGNEVFLPFAYAVMRNSPEDDFFSDDFLENVFLTDLKLVLPDGTFPTLEDSWRYKSLCVLYPSSFENISLFHWLWWFGYDEFTAEGYSLPSSLLLIPAMCIYSDSIAPSVPDFSPDVFLPEAGYAVFRSDWSSSADYILMMCEHDRARLAGLMHEHPDQTSIIAASSGKLGIISGGYPGWDMRDISNHPEDHNIILVDGCGPPMATPYTRAGVDGFLFGWANFFKISAVACSCSYCECNFQRRLIWIPDLCWFIADKAQGEEEHTYTHLVHAIGSVDSGDVVAGSDGIAINLTTTQMKSFTYSTNPSATHYTAPDSFGIYWHKLASSTVFSTESEGTTAYFLWHLVPRSERDIDYQIWRSEGAVVRTMICGEDTAISAIVEYGDTLPALPDEFIFDMDGWLAVISPLGDSILSLHTAGATFLDFRGKRIFHTDTITSITMTFDFKNHFITGHCEDSTAITIEHLLSMNIDSALINGETSEFSYDGEKVSFNVPAESDFIVYLSPGDKILSNTIKDRRMLKIYPSPFAEKCDISISTSGSADIKILDISGKCVFSENIANGVENRHIIWQPDENITDGVYFVIVRNSLNNKKVMRKIVYLR
ncbi:hypothetical protein DRQ26_03400, partial [bacterium]